MNGLKTTPAMPYPPSVSYPVQLHQPPLMQGLPSPPPSIAYDVNEFRRFFQFGLSQLQYNNKYIINDLTTLASVYHHRMSTYIAKDIELHLRESLPSHRLIGFYVIDSICKNLGHPFPELFKPFVERLFLTAYREIEDVDPTIKVKFEELLGTWRTGSVTQRELFGPDVQRRIEDGVFGAWRHGSPVFDSQAFLNGIKQQPAVATPAEKASILFDLRRILSERERIAANYPHDQANLAQMATLQQLEQLVAHQQLTVNQVEEIRQQLQPLRPPTPPPPVLDLGLGTTSLASLISHLPQPPLPFNQPQLHQHHPDPPLENAVDLPDPGSLASLTRLLEANPSLAQAVQQAGSAPVAQTLSDQGAGLPFTLDAATQLALASVVNNQPATGLHSAPPNFFCDQIDNQKLAAALASVNPSTECASEAPSRERSAELGHQHSPAPSTLSTGDNVTHSHPDPAIMEYENMIAGLEIHLQTTSINRTKPEDIADVLYSHIPQLCRQDGSRFLCGRTGDQRASQHLDWHFRLQRRARESGQRAQQRVWSQLEASWLESHDFGVSIGGDPSRVKVVIGRKGGEMKSRKNGSKVDEKSMMVDLKKKSVVRPACPELASRPCPICREGFETRFDEDEDEFYWMNAVESSSKEVGKKVVYHATCHYETIRNKARLKMRNELEENRLKRIGEEIDVKKDNKVSATASLGLIPAAVGASEGLVLQEDESFFGGDESGGGGDSALEPRGGTAMNVPKIKLEPDSLTSLPAPSLSLPTNSTIEQSNLALGKRKKPFPSASGDDDGETAWSGLVSQDKGSSCDVCSSGLDELNKKAKIDNATLDCETIFLRAS